MYNLGKELQGTLALNASANGVIAPAQKSIDLCNSINITATVDDLVIQFDKPTDLTAGQMFTVSCMDKPFTLFATKISKGSYATFRWNGINYDNQVTNSIASGGIIAVAKKLPSLAVFQFENLRIRWNAPTNRFEIATVAGTTKLDYVAGVNWGEPSSNNYNGGAGVYANAPATLVDVTTTYSMLGYAGINGVYLSRIHMQLITGEQYIVEFVRKGVNYLDGNVTYIAYKI